MVGPILALLAVAFFYSRRISNGTNYNFCKRL